MEAKRRLQGRSPGCGAIPERIGVYHDGAHARERACSGAEVGYLMSTRDASANANVADLAAPVTSRTKER